MQLGYMSALLPEWSLEQILSTAKEIGYDCVEVMCWPVGTDKRKFGGVTHIDLDRLDDREIARIHQLVADTGVSISGLGYYPNPLSPDRETAELAVGHIYKLLEAAKRLGLGQVHSFIGRDPTQTVDAQWPRMLEVWRPIVRRAEELGLRIGIENCPMLSHWHEWPGGVNLFNAPRVWRRMFEDIPSPNFGMNYDPSHLVWTMIDPVPPIYEFKDRIFHVHAKDARVDWDVLQDVGILHPVGWHTPKLPGMGDCDWASFFGALTDIKFSGAVCAEVEDAAFEGPIEQRRRSLVQCHRFLSQYVVNVAT
jgi:sugar phosphate isomerase/epimerase